MVVVPVKSTIWVVTAVSSHSCRSTVCRCRCWLYCSIIAVWSRWITCLRWRRRGTVTSCTLSCTTWTDTSTFARRWARTWRTSWWARRWRSTSSSASTSFKSIDLFLEVSCYVILKKICTILCYQIPQSNIIFLT